MTSTRLGGALLIAGVGWFYVLQLLTAAAWPAPGYNWRRNAVSDLGNTACGPFGFYGPTIWVCSPWHRFANIGFVLVGLSLASGFWLLRPFWGEQGALPHLGTALMVLAGAGTAAVGLAPENVRPWLHIAAAQCVPVLGIAGALLALATLRSPAARDPRRRGPAGLLGRVGIATALIAFVGGLWSAIAEVFGSGTAWLLGLGGLERLTLYPSTVWVLAVGVAAVVRPRLLADAVVDKPVPAA